MWSAVLGQTAGAGVTIRRDDGSDLEGLGTGDETGRR